jgi:PKD repeat protein
MNRRRAILALIAAVLAALQTIVGLSPTAAQAASQPAGRLVSDDPVGFTPHVLDGSVYAIAQVGNTVILGGSFSQTRSSSDPTVVNRSRLVAFNATTGVISTTFLPNPNGTINAIVPAADGTSIYVGGSFSSIAGSAVKNLARITVADGSLVAGFDGGSPTGQVKDLKLANGRLWVGGTFTHIRGRAQRALATLNATTGAFDTFFTGVVDGVHKADSVTNVYKMDVSPDGTRLIAVGNFDTLDGVKNHQFLQLDLAGATAAPADFRTTFFEAGCSSSFDTYMRDVDFSPDGSFAVVSTTGAYGGASGPCDSTSRWDMGQTGSDVQPSWVNYTGGDTTYAVEVTSTAVYVGGHQRWQNNPFAGDTAGAGAVSRPGIAALNPINGIPFSWNPTRDRGVGVFDFLSTSQGLWVASDTDRIGNYEYHAKIALLPAAGQVVPAVSTAPFPNDVYSAGALGSASDPRVLYRVNGGGSELSASKGIDWADDSSGTNSYATPHNAAGYGTVGSVDGTVPAGTPNAIFNSEAWDSWDSQEMTWSFPVPSGTPVQVRLYFANRYDGTAQAGQRVFNVGIDDTAFLTDFDIAAAVGHNVGTMRSKDIVSDGSVDISFGHIVENPLINGIEIIRTDLPAAASGSLAKRSFDGSTAGPSMAVADGGVDWDTVRGGFMVNGVLYTALSDGSFVKRTFNGSAFGTAEVLAVQDQLVVLQDWHNEAAVATGLFFDSGRIYYTLSGSSTLYYRYFDTESGIVGAQRLEAGGNVDGINFAAVRGMFLGAGKLYWATNDGTLHAIDWAEHPASGAPVADTAAIVSGPAVDGQSWSARAMFLYQDAAGEGAGQPPVAQFAITCAGMACEVDGSASSVAGASITSYAWNWGDGSTTSGVTSSHTFLAEGAQTVTLTVTSSRGATSQVSQLVSVEAPNVGPVASFTTTCTLLDCTFDASGSSDPDGSIVAWDWQFGETGTGAGATAPHTFAAPGTYQVTLTVTDDEGALSEKTESVKVVSSPTADFTSTCVSLTCTFDASGSLAPGSAVATYTWTYPGGTGSGETDAHTFAGSGSYPVTLEIETLEGLTAQVTRNIVVTRTNTSPTADFTVDCDQLECSFDASGSSDPDGSISGFAWDFDDGHTGTGASADHTFAADGSFHVTLTVTDNDGATGTITRTVEVSAATVTPVASAATGGNRTTFSVTIPSEVAAGDQLLLFFTGNSTATITAPSGWTQVRATDGSGYRGRAWARTATATSAGSTVAVTSSAQVKGGLVVAAYRSSTGTVDLDSSAVATGSGSTSIQTPAIALGSGTLVVDYLGIKANAAPTLGLPTDLVQRQSVTGSGSGGVYAWLADSGQYLSGGSFGPHTLTFGTSAARSVAYAVGLRAHAPQPPTAAFSVQCVSRTCSFDASAATAPGSSITGYAWTFGDGDTGTGRTPTHAYTADDTYQVTLVVTTADAMTDDVSHAVEVVRVNQAPTAAFGADCTLLDCEFDAAGSADSDGTVASYAWEFGDGDEAAGASPEHSFDGRGTYQVKLTVTDNEGATDSTTKDVTVSDALVEFVNSAATNGNRTSHSVTIPAGVQAGDQLLLFLSTNSDAVITAPAGWTPLQTTAGGSGFEARAWARTAVAGDAGTAVTARTTAQVKSSLTVGVYRSTTGTVSVAASAVQTASSASSITTPQQALGTGSLVVDFVGLKASSATTATLPGSLTSRRATSGSGSGAIYSWLADSGDYLSGGNFGGSSVAFSGSASRAVAYGVVLRAA